MEDRYWIYVEKNGKNIEFVESVKTLKEANLIVDKFRKNRDKHISQGTGLAYHYKGLEWKIVDMGEEYE